MSLMKALGAAVGLGTGFLTGSPSAGLAAGAPFFSADEQAQANKRNADMQYDFAQKGIRWKVNDAKEAGLHPLFALGASTPTASPSFQVGGVGQAMADLGQNLSRSARATMTPNESELQDLQIAEIKSRIAENDARTALLRSQAARNGQNPANGLPPVNSLELPFGDIRTSPTEKSETIENEYGDLAQEIYGTGRLLNDLGMNFTDAVKRQNPWWLKLYRSERKRNKSVFDQPSFDKVKKHFNK